MDTASPVKQKDFLRVHLKITHSALCDAFLDLLPLVVIMASITLIRVIINLAIPHQEWVWLKQLNIMHVFLKNIFLISHQKNL